MQPLIDGQSGNNQNGSRRSQHSKEFRKREPNASTRYTRGLQDGACRTTKVLTKKQRERWHTSFWSKRELDVLFFIARRFFVFGQRLVPHVLGNPKLGLHWLGYAFLDLATLLQKLLNKRVIGVVFRYLFHLSPFYSALRCLLLAHHRLDPQSRLRRRRFRIFPC